MTQHNPRPGESYGTRLLSHTPSRKIYKVIGQRDGQPIRGELTLKLVDGEYDGYDWTGTPLTEDQQQAVLDLFAD